PQLQLRQNKSANIKSKSSPVKSSSSIANSGNRKKVSFYQGDYGIGWVEIKNVEIKVTAADSTLTPLGDDDNTGKPNARVIDWTKRNTTDVTVTVTDIENNPVPDYPFTLSAFVRPNSGGHDHNTNRPTGKFVTPNNDTLATFQGSTNGDGKATYAYICSGFGGVDSIFVKGKTARDISTATILLQFPGLQELTEGDHYVLVGRTSTHEINHYGTSTTISRLKELADSAYADSSWVLQYNDMSLINGGPFDYKANWNTPHQFHREGKNTDMRITSTDGDLISSQWLRDFFKINKYGTVVDEDKTTSNHHFHLTFQ
ncbi:MAG TPA: hypothetical protein VLX91_08925, partial [Candidatus Acidoferrales bacterium]|nr:hypothetical protein [Candidatus Acidoferrales bacterium]